jgi:hypothetical protein
MKYRPLPTQQELHELFEYRDGNLYWRNNRSNNTLAGSRAGTIKKNSYCQIHFSGKPYVAHRLIYSMFYDDLTTELEVDHIDNNPGNNKIENLRIASSSENKHNQSIRKNNTSGVKGVSWDTQANKWKAQICKDGKNQHIGHFTDLAEATIKIEQVRNQLHQKFTNHGL